MKKLILPVLVIGAFMFPASSYAGFQLIIPNDPKWQPAIQEYQKKLDEEFKQKAQTKSTCSNGVCRTESLDEYNARKEVEQKKAVPTVNTAPAPIIVEQKIEKVTNTPVTVEEFEKEDTQAQIAILLKQIIFLQAQINAILAQRAL